MYWVQEAYPQSSILPGIVLDRIPLYIRISDRYPIVPLKKNIELDWDIVTFVKSNKGVKII